MQRPTLLAEHPKARAYPIHSPTHTHAGKHAPFATGMQVINESFMHNVPKGAETHFKVVVVSDTFTDVALIKRHRTVNTLLKEELATGVHALTIQAKTVAQWEQSGHAVEPSPKCLGGAGK
jgi:stress-induced morphogen